MSHVFLEMTMTLDGFTAAPGVSLEHPLGIDGERVHEWMLGSGTGDQPRERAMFNPGYGTEGAADAAPDEIDRSVAARHVRHDRRVRDRTSHVRRRRGSVGRRSTSSRDVRASS